MHLDEVFLLRQIFCWLKKNLTSLLSKVSELRNASFAFSNTVNVLFSSENSCSSRKVGKVFMVCLASILLLVPNISIYSFRHFYPLFAILCRLIYLSSRILSSPYFSSQVLISLNSLKGYPNSYPCTNYSSPFSDIFTLQSFFPAQK